MADNELMKLAGLLRTRNTIDSDFAAIIQRPMSSGHLGEFLASRIFDIELEASATQAAIDGRFRSGPLAGQTVNVKWYLKREGLLDMTTSPLLDQYLVMSGPASGAASSRGTTRPWVISNVYLFDARALAEDLELRGRRIGVASSVRADAWLSAEVYPRPHPLLPLTAEQRAALGLFAPEKPT